MTRGRTSALQPFPLLMCVLVLSAVVPTRFTQWVEMFREPVTFLVRPISDPLSRLAQQSTSGGNDEAMLELEKQRNEVALELARAHDRINELERLITDMQGGIAMAPELSLEMLAAPVTGSTSFDGSAILRVGAGAREGVVVRATVAVVRGVYLIGRVISVESRTSSVLPFTAGNSGLLRGLVMPKNEGSRALPCYLEPGEGRTLQGDMDADTTLEDVEIGQLVRLDDDEWPQSAQMLVLGRIENIHTRENGRISVRIKPEVDPTRVSDVVLRIPLQGGGV